MAEKRESRSRRLSIGPLYLTLICCLIALEDAVVDHLLEIAIEVDQNDAGQTLSPQELKSTAQTKGVKRITIVDARSQPEPSDDGLSSYAPLLEGTRDMVILPFKRLSPNEGDLFSVVVRRTAGEGIIDVSIDYSQMKDLRRRFAIQNILDTMGFAEGIQYLSVFDDSFSLVAQIRNEEMGEILDAPFLKSVQGGIGQRSHLPTERRNLCG